MTRDERKELSVLMARLADGERETISTLFSRLWPVVRGFAGRVLMGHPDAEDVGQRALLAVFSRAAQYDRNRDALAWVLGITRWECRTAMRTAARRRELPLRQDEPTDARSPEDALLDAELRGAFAEGLAELSAEDRQALGLESSLPSVLPATLRKRRQRALARFRENWKKHEGD
jgi:RNA polymerase sigma factor (sigma-70 family)